MKIRLIGDIHGDFEGYKQLVSDAEESIQIGDHGLGFDKWEDKKHLAWLSSNPQHKFIRGNHDSSKVCKKSPNYLGDWGFLSNNQVMFVSGAWSIDYYARREEVSWWPDEELPQKEFDEIEKAYILNSPKIMITHDAPYKMPIAMGLINPAFGGSVLTRTGYRLQRLLSYHIPEKWFFGHWHKSAEKGINGCLYRCLNIGEFVDIDEETYRTD